MVSTETAKNLSRELRQSLLEYMRDKHCPEVTNDEWHEIKLNIDEHVENTSHIFAEAMYTARNEPEKAKSDQPLMKLDKMVRENLDDINLDDFDGSDLGSDMLKEAFVQAKKMKDER